MNSICDLMADTKEYRSVLRQALQRQGLVVHQDRTRPFSGSYYTLYNKYRNLLYDSRETRNLRTVIFWVGYDPQKKDALDAALAEPEIWFELCGKKMDISLAVENSYWIIKNTCVMLLKKP